MSGHDSSAECGGVVVDKPVTTASGVRISAAAAAAIAVRPIPMEAVRAGATVAASIAIRRAAEANTDQTSAHEDIA